MPTTATKTEQKGKVEDTLLVQYDPSVREKGTFSETRIAIMPTVDGKVTPTEVRRGVQEMSRSEWELWTNNKSADVQYLISSGALRLRSEEAAIEKLDPVLAQELVSNTYDVLLLQKWVKQYRDLPPVVQEAMRLKNDSIESQAKVKGQFLFGQQVA